MTQTKDPIQVAPSQELPMHEMHTIHELVVKLEKKILSLEKQIVQLKASNKVILDYVESLQMMLNPKMNN